MRSQYSLSSAYGSKRRQSYRGSQEIRSFHNANVAAVEYPVISGAATNIASLYKTNAFASLNGKRVKQITVAKDTKVSRPCECARRSRLDRQIVLVELHGTEVLAQPKKSMAKLMTGSKVRREQPYRIEVLWDS